MAGEASWAASPDAGPVSASVPAAVPAVGLARRSTPERKVRRLIRPCSRASTLELSSSRSLSRVWIWEDSCRFCPSNCWRACSRAASRGSGWFKGLLQLGTGLGQFAVPLAQFLGSPGHVPTFLDQEQGYADDADAEDCRAHGHCDIQFVSLSHGICLVVT